jgi:AraC-like DNA-binding protein
VVGLLPTAAGALLRRGWPADLSSGLADALRYVHGHLHRPFSVDELAEAACMSRSTFYRHFRRALGVTPLQYVTRVRMERACTLLRGPDRTVTDVALDLGFRSVSHFITTFKQHVGTTPRAYQERSGRARRLAGDA